MSGSCQNGSTMDEIDPSIFHADPVKGKSMTVARDRAPNSPLGRCTK